MNKIQPYSRLNQRSMDVDLCDKNENVLQLSEVVKRWHESGQFMMSEVNHSDAYEGKSVDLNTGDIIGRISKLESYLMGIHAVNEVKASTPSEKASTEIPAPSSETPSKE